MARWKLTEAHYLRVPGTKWEYTEIDRITGRPKRTPFDVPLLLNPMDIGDLQVYGQPDPFLGQNGDPIIVVTNNPNPAGRDVYFTSDVTPGMLPLDDEAKALTEEAAKGKWKPTTGIDPEAQNTSYTNKLLSGLIDQMTDVKLAAQAAPPAHGLDELLKTMTAMMQQNQQILTMLVDKSSQPERRRVA